jgi:hypothetical protein
MVVGLFEYSAGVVSSSNAGVRVFSADHFVAGDIQGI